MTQIPLSVSVVVPMYNEKDQVEELVSRLGELLETADGDHELLIVDDGSSDGSSEIADQLAASNDFLRVIHLKSNKGIGAALKAGFLAAKYDLIFYTDSDLPVALDCLSRAKVMLVDDQADFVVGRRVGKRESFMRVVYSSVYNGILGRLFAVKQHDLNCPMKMFRRSLIGQMHLRSEGPFIDAELLLRARKMGFRVAEIDVRSIPRHSGYSKFASPRSIVPTMLKMIFEMLRYYPER